MLSTKEQKFIKSLKVKKYRIREKCFLVEGVKNVEELMRSDLSIEMIIGSERFFESHQIVSSRKERVNKKLLSQLSTFKTNEDVIAVAKMRQNQLSEINYDGYLFVLDAVKDPGNVGTIVRTLDWFGHSQLVCSEDCVDYYSPKVINSSMGSFARVKVYEAELGPFLSDVKIPIYGADLAGMPLANTRIPAPALIVMGSESHGLSATTHKYLNQKLSIAKLGSAESLNVAIATGIIVHQLSMVR